MFTGGSADWTNLVDFLNGVVLPYFIGGLGPGIVIGFALYRISRPLIAAYQTRRKHRLMARFRDRSEAALKKAAPAAAGTARAAKKAAQALGGRIRGADEGGGSD